MKKLSVFAYKSGLFVALCLAAGCATKPQPRREFTFFPPPPDEPRIQYLTSFGSEDDLGGGPSKFKSFVVGNERVVRPIWEPYGIPTSPGKIFVCDTEPDNVCLLDLVKRRITYLRPTGQAAMVLPMNIAVDKDGTRYVTDIKRGQVLIYDKNGEFLAALGKKAEMRPCGIAVSGDRFYVTDMTNRCVRVYDKARRELLFTVPRRPPGDEKSILFGPTNVAIDREGKIYVSDSSGFAIKIFDAEGNHLQTIGDLGLQPGKFALPKGIGVDREGRIYVVDAATAVVQVFDPSGRLLMYFGMASRGGRGALYLPAALSIDYENVDLFKPCVAPGLKIEFLILVTNQAGPNKVNVYGFLREG